MTPAGRRSALAQPLHRDQPGAHRRHDRRPDRPRHLADRRGPRGRRDDPRPGAGDCRPGHQLRRPEMARPQMADPARPMKRFYEDARIARPDRAAGRSCSTGVRCRTPAREALELPDRARWPKRSPRNGTRRATRSIRARCRSPASPMPRSTGSAPDPEAFARSPRALRRERPALLPGRRAAAARRAPGRGLGSAADWARRRFDVDFDGDRAGSSIAPQPQATIDRLGRAVAARDPFALAGTVAAGDHLGLAGHRAGAGRRRDRPRRGLGGRHRRRSLAGRRIGARTRSPPPRSKRGGASSKPPTVS